MTQFSIVFTRYLNGQRVISQPVFLTAKNFNDACSVANHRLAGMIDADELGQYAIVSIASDSYSGITAEHLGRNMFDSLKGDNDAG